MCLCVCACVSNSQLSHIIFREANPTTAKTLGLATREHQFVCVFVYTMPNMCVRSLAACVCVCKAMVRDGCVRLCARSAFAYIPLCGVLVVLVSLSPASERGHFR